MAEKRILRSSPVAGLVVSGLLMIAGCGSGSHHSTATTSSATSSPSGQGTTSSGRGGSSAEALQEAFVAVVAKIRPEVVEISTASGLGSGVIFDTRGDIVTNDHVVGSATAFKVHLVNGQTLNASLVGAYPPDDLAVIRAQGAHNLSPATFGDSRALRVGDIVFAVGNPLGLSSSVTEGIVSYNGRAVSEGNGITLPSTIQTSAPINPGNSGGALANLQSQVVGIPTLAAVNQQAGGTAAGIGFAIPSDTVKLIVPQLISTGHVTNSGRAALGITGADAVDELGRPAGVIVSQVTPNGGAEKAGIVAGDVITNINGQAIMSLADLQAVLAGLTPRATARVTVVNQSGASRTVEVVLGQLTG